MLQRTANLRPGYDCRTVCTHTPRGDHGISSDRWIFAVRDMDRHIALEFVISTPNYPVSVGERYIFYRSFSPSVLIWHYAHPTSKDEVLGSPAADCDYLGKCYRNNGSTTYERELFERIFVMPSAGTHTPEQPESFWLALEHELDTRATALEAARLEDGDLKWKVCGCCHGERVVPV